MYTNIDTQHGLKILKQWFDDLEDELTPDFPAKAVLKAVQLIIENNVFQFWRYLLAPTNRYRHGNSSVMHMGYAIFWIP